MNIRSTNRPQRAQTGGHRVRQTATKSEPSEQASITSRLDFIDLDGLRELAGVRKPGFFSRMFDKASGWVSGIQLALAIGPTLGHLVVAKELAKLDSMWNKDQQQAPMDWLRDNRPGAFTSSFGNVMVAGSAPLQAVMGLSLSDLTEVEEHYYRVLAPTKNESGVKTTAPYLQELAKSPELQPGQARSAFVFLGEDRVSEAKSVTDIWNSPDRPEENPFQPEDQRHRIWASLQTQADKGKLPIFVDIDGDYKTFTGTEYVAKLTLSSLGKRNNSLGDDFADTSRYFAWLAERQESFSRDLDPYFKSCDPQAARTVQKIKAILTPPWLEGEKGIGPFLSPPVVKTVPKELSELKRTKGDNAWVDALVSLDRDTLTGVQTHWVKLLREITRPDRENLLGQVPEKFFQLNLLAPQDEGFGDVAPADGPMVSEVIPHKDLVTKRRPYDRAVGLKELLDHSLDGLGIDERRDSLRSIRGLATKNMPALKARETRLRESLGAGYVGLDIAKVLLSLIHI